MSLALVDSNLKELIQKEIFNSTQGFNLNDFVEPASIDIPVGKTAYLVKQKVLPFSRDVQYIADQLCIEKIDLTKGAVLLKGQTYLIPCLDIDLPENLTIKLSPKSSIGRIDLLVRAIVDKTGLYDMVFPNTKGSLWLEVSPQSFNVRLTAGQTLNQLRVFEESQVNSNEVKKEIENSSFLFDENKNKVDQKIFENNRLFLGLDVKENSLVGYEAIPTNEVIDLAQIGKLSFEKFFREIRTNHRGKITLEKDKFYILATKENISVPHEYSVEMVPFSHLVGELRAHYAGFFDPGFGRETGATGVLEIRPHETLTLYDGQPICFIEVFKNKIKPQISYGENGNNYQGQVGPKLAKYFK